MSLQENDSGQHQQLGVIIERLKTFIEESQVTETDKIYEEIRKEIRSLNKKVSGRED